MEDSVQLKNETKSDPFYKYEEIFDDHMEIAKKKFIEQFGREPDFDEHLNYYRELIEFFYD